MQIFTHKGYEVVIVTRGEHCPPHAHVKGPDWEARLEFSFVADDVDLLSVKAKRKKPPKHVTDELCDVLGEAENLRKARDIWWFKTNLKTCLVNRWWDLESQMVVKHRPNSMQIQSAEYDTVKYMTKLILKEPDGSLVALEIEL